ncbi:MAG: hypothetical protein FVQ80_19280 [Planctomycetes bacterium]|nr:hypothetical protein [Planctomycetota bacterium]
MELVMALIALSIIPVVSIIVKIISNYKHKGELNKSLEELKSQLSESGTAERVSIFLQGIIDTHVKLDIKGANGELTFDELEELVILNETIKETNKVTSEQYQAAVKAFEDLNRRAALWERKQEGK